VSLNLLHNNGFQIERKYGNYEQAPYTHSSLKQVIVCTGR
jgi:hypothetical protein